MVFVFLLNMFLLFIGKKKEKLLSSSVMIILMITPVPSSRYSNLLDALAVVLLLNFLDSLPFKLQTKEFDVFFVLLYVTENAV